MKSKLTLLLSLLLFFSTAQAQNTFAKPEEFKTLKERTLLVELLVEDNAQIQKWTNKKNKAKKPEVAKKYESKIGKYREFITEYNKHIKEAVESIWDLNKNIEYKTTTQIRFMKNDKEQYTVLGYEETESDMKDQAGQAYFPDLSIPTLTYSRIEKPHFKPDYSFFMPYLGEKEDNISLAHLILSLKLMQQHILEIENSGKKKFTFKKYAVMQAKQNCPKLTGKDVAIIESRIHKKASLANIQKEYSQGDVVGLTDDQVKNAIVKNEDVIIGIFIPQDIIAGAAGPLAVARILFTTCFMNVSTGEIYSCTGTVMGEFNDHFYRSKGFKKLGVCK